MTDSVAKQRQYDLAAMMFERVYPNMRFYELDPASDAWAAGIDAKYRKLADDVVAYVEATR